MNTISNILDLARWAPSGDNSQPWRFEVVSESHVVLHMLAEGHGNVYELGGGPSQMAIGALLETLRIAASAHGKLARAERRLNTPNEFAVFDVWLDSTGAVTADPLHTVIKERSVQRKALSPRALTAQEKASLESAVGSNYSIIWFEGWRARLRATSLALLATRIRLSIPEAYKVHCKMIEWNAQFSETKMPDQALGLSGFTLRSMQWSMASWSRVSMMNRYFGGTLAPSLELDLIPGLFCAAHFAIVAKNAPINIDDHVAAGAAMQRFWLTATSLKLQLQPQFAPLTFAAYARTGRSFTADTKAIQQAHALAKKVSGVFGENTPKLVVLGRVGSGPAAEARSLRRPLDQLLWNGPAASVPPSQPQPVDSSEGQQP